MCVHHYLFRNWGIKYCMLLDLQTVSFFRRKDALVWLPTPTIFILEAHILINKNLKRRQLTICSEHKNAWKASKGFKRSHFATRSHMHMQGKRHSSLSKRKIFARMLSLARNEWRKFSSADFIILLDEAARLPTLWMRRGASPQAAL